MEQPRIPQRSAIKLKKEELIGTEFQSTQANVLIDYEDELVGGNFCFYNIGKKGNLDYTKVLTFLNKRLTVLNQESKTIKRIIKILNARKSN